MVKAIMTVRFFNLVARLPHEGTPRRIEETAGIVRVRSCAVSRLIGESLRSGDVDSVNIRLGF